MLGMRKRFFTLIKSKGFIGLVLSIIGVTFVFIPFYVWLEMEVCFSIVGIGCIVFFIGFRFMTLKPGEK